MDIWDENKLLIFIAFVIPGFISIKIYNLLFPGVARSSSEQVIDAVAYSCITYAVMLWPIYEVEVRNYRKLHPTFYVGFYVAVLLFVPITLALVLRFIRQLSVVQRLVPHPTARPWDYVFGKRRSYWVIVTLKDEKRIAGKYCRNSFSSSAPAPEQIYLEEAWVLNDDGGFERKRTESAGILILSTEILTIEFFNVTEEESNE